MAKLTIPHPSEPRDPLKTLPPLPPSSHAKPVDSFAAAAELEKELQKTVEGEVRFDRGSRALYAADASNYRQVPIGLVIPRDEGDVIATVAACKKFGAPVLPRGAGTSLAGQCCNVAVVLDFTKYMNRILEIDAEARFARVQPGVVLDRLRERAELHHLTFGPDPSTHSRCTLGGMIGNNSCGTHSLLAGKTVDNVEQLRVLLYDGTQLEVGATPQEELSAIIAAGGRKGEIYSRLRNDSRSIRRADPRALSENSPARFGLQPRSAPTREWLPRGARAGGQRRYLRHGARSQAPAHPQSAAQNVAGIRLSGRLHRRRAGARNPALWADRIGRI